MSVKLQPATAWTCPECDHRNYAEAVPVEITQEDRALQPEVFAGTETGDWVCDPGEVSCADCGETFAVDNGDPVGV